MFGTKKKINIWFHYPKPEYFGVIYLLSNLNQERKGISSIKFV